MFAFLLAFAASHFLTWSVSPRVLLTGRYGTTVPLVIQVKTRECPQVGILIDGPTFRKSIMTPIPDHTLQVSYSGLSEGEYEIGLYCVDLHESIIEGLRAGQVTVR